MTANEIDCPDIYTFILCISRCQELGLAYHANAASRKIFITGY